MLKKDTFDAILLGMLHYKGRYENIDATDTEFEIPDADGFYQYEKNKSIFPAYHFRMSAYDLALYGILYANGGRWQGKQIVSKSWIEKVRHLTRLQIEILA